MFSTPIDLKTSPGLSTALDSAFLVDSAHIHFSASYSLLLLWLLILTLCYSLSQPASAKPYIENGIPTALSFADITIKMSYLFLNPAKKRWHVCSFPPPPPPQLGHKDYLDTLSPPPLQESVRTDGHSYGDVIRS